MATSVRSAVDAKHGSTRGRLWLTADARAAVDLLPESRLAPVIVGCLAVSLRARGLTWACCRDDGQLHAGGNRDQSG